MSTDSPDCMRFSWPSGDALNGAIELPGDKSISHRAVMLGALAEGVTRVQGFLNSADCLATVEVMRRLGVRIEHLGTELRIHGVGLHGLQAPAEPLDCGNSGTAMRLLAGLLSAQPFNSVLIGDASLQQRPMRRIIEPLTAMGAQIHAEQGTPPLHITGGHTLHAIAYRSPIASAQVKSCVMLAGLYATGVTEISEPVRSRNHTETMLRGFGCAVTVADLTVQVAGGQNLKAQTLSVPADPSSAAFFVVLALCLPQARLTLPGVGINPTRDGLLRILQAMGARIELNNHALTGGEPVADLVVHSSPLRGVDVPVDWLPSAIDELPVLCIAAACAEGVTRIRGAEELRHKESDRIAVMVAGLRACGVRCEEFPDGMHIHGGAHWRDACVDAQGDHRCAMSFLIAGCLNAATITVKGCEQIGTSFPDFVATAQRLGVQSHVQ